MEKKLHLAFCPWFWKIIPSSPFQDFLKVATFFFLIVYKGRFFIIFTRQPLIYLGKQNIQLTPPSLLTGQVWCTILKCHPKGDLAENEKV